jgi:hypothetical protein
VFEIDMAHCPNCGGELKIIRAIIQDPGVFAVAISAASTSKLDGI